MQLRDKRAVITGAASGLGEAIALGFAAQGARLWLIDRDAEGLRRMALACTQTGLEVGTSVADLATAEQPEQAIEQALAGLGGIDILVNSAGIAGQGSCLELTIEQWDQMLAIDLRSVFLCCRQALPAMIAQRWGWIINIASQLGIKGAPELSYYAAAKAGVIGFSKSLALEVVQHNVLVNVIAPGPVETPMLGDISAGWKAAKAAELPLGRFGRPEELVPSAVLLASEPGGNLYLGQMLGPNLGDVMP
ncbi:MAG: SDR family oxidoreductase [Rhodanobacter sp.]|nr:MAG: SDR family oxidoreductase [Rhodanobacter sp.]TAN28551.1 MAG: SDR family oxidoreductase [Rhodanobacter sp.]